MSDASGGDAKEEVRETTGASDGSAETRGGEDPSIEELRERVEEKYDFEEFTPADMAEMSAEEWQAAFDPDTWITGPDLLDRVEAELKRRVADRQLFAVVERVEYEGEERIAAYSGSDYAIVSPDGTVEGEGMALREVKPIVALCSMEDFEAGPMPTGEGPMLPDPGDVEASTGSLGDRLVLVVAGALGFSGLAMILLPLFVDLGANTGGFLLFVIGLIFLVIAVVVGTLVANARLSGRFRAEEYRERLRAAGVGSTERPEFLPFESEGSPALDGTEERPIPDEEAPDGRDA